MFWYTDAGLWGASAAGERAENAHGLAVSILVRLRSAFGVDPHGCSLTTWLAWFAWVLQGMRTDMCVLVWVERCILMGRTRSVQVGVCPQAVQLTGARELPAVLACTYGSRLLLHAVLRPFNQTIGPCAAGMLDKDYVILFPPGVRRVPPPP